MSKFYSWRDITYKKQDGYNLSVLRLLWKIREVCVIYHYCLSGYENFHSKSWMNFIDINTCVELLNLVCYSNHRYSCCIIMMNPLKFFLLNWNNMFWNLQVEGRLNNITWVTMIVYKPKPNQLIFTDLTLFIAISFTPMYVP